MKDFIYNTIVPITCLIIFFLSIFLLTVFLKKHADTPLIQKEITHRIHTEQDLKSALAENKVLWEALECQELKLQIGIITEQLDDRKN